jgi:REP element-mobilizing transposase RayT
LRYFITFACYGTHLHGEESGSVDRKHNLPGSRVLEPDAERAAAERGRMAQAPYRLDEDSRAAVIAALRNHCAHRGWALLAAHVRTNHVHAIVEAGVRPERVMNEFKSYASRELNRLDREGPDRKRWARHGSTRWLLWKDSDVQEAIQYVIDEQGEPMALFVAQGL